MIVSAQGSVSETAEVAATAQITCIVAATGLAFSARPVSKGKIIARYVKRHIFFLKIWFAEKYQSLVKKRSIENTKSGGPEITGPPSTGIY